MRSYLVTAATLPAVLASCGHAVGTNSSSCIVTEYSQLANAVATCTDITLQDLYAPANNFIDLTKLKDGSKVTFAGTTVRISRFFH